MRFLLLPRVTGVVISTLLCASVCARGDDPSGPLDDSVGSGETSAADDATAPADGRVGESGVRRLSRNEMDNTLFDILGDDSRPATRFLPEDVIDPFDSDFTTQRVSAVLIEGLESLAADVSARLLDDDERLAELLGCEPSGASDRACMEQFVATVGRRLLRRTVTADEVEQWSAFGLDFAEQRSDFNEGVDVVLRMLLQHPQFVYRVEIGTPTNEPGVYRLGSHEIAARLSYFLWGSTPDDELLDAADADELATTPDLEQAVARIMADERARDRVDRFHAMWLGFHQLPHDVELTQALRRETRALIEDVVFADQAAWLELFTASGSFLNDYLARHYGLPEPGSDDMVWVDYGDSGRRGLLSQGAFLSLGAKFADTSPTMRGLAIRTRLLCQSIPPPPPDIDTDNPPGDGDPGTCKVDRYAEHRENGACKGCHELMDPIGFGLENYDSAGRFREHDVDDDTCTIDGVGAIGEAEFQGPAGLADLLVEGDDLDACLVRQVYRFAMGHDVHADDRALVDDLTAGFRADDHRFDQLMIRLVTDEAFLFRKEAEEGSW